MPSLLYYVKYDHQEHVSGTNEPSKCSTKMWCPLYLPYLNNLAWSFFRQGQREEAGGGRGVSKSFFDSEWRFFANIYTAKQVPVSALYVGESGLSQL